MTDAPLYLSPAEQAAFLHTAPSLAGRVNVHRLGSDEDHAVHQSRVRLAHGVAEFYMCRDCETYGWVLNSAGESKVFNVFRSVLDDGKLCTRHPSASTVLDIGANEGFFGLLSASWGCLTYFFEPQPSCQSHIYASLRLNDFGPSVARLVPRPVGAYVTSIAVSPTAHCAGQYPRREGDRAEVVHPMRMRSRSDVRRAPRVDLKPLLRGEHVALAKVDVEGAEMDVLQTLLPFMCRKRVRNVIVELSPLWWTQLNTSFGAALQLAANIDKCGFRLRTTAELRVGRLCMPPCIGSKERRAAWAAPPPGELLNVSFREHLVRSQGAFQHDVWLSVDGAA